MSEHSNNTAQSTALTTEEVMRIARTIFDEEYYLATNPDVAAAGVDPFQHFMNFGFNENRDPSALFDLSFYRQQRPDVAESGANPLLHFIRSGAFEDTNNLSGGPQSNPSPFFDPGGYLSRFTDVANAGVNPLVHYSQTGEREIAAGARPDVIPGFDVQGYARVVPEIALDLDTNDFETLLEHFIRVGQPQGIEPQPAGATFNIERLADELAAQNVDLSPLDDLFDDVAGTGSPIRPQAPGGAGDGFTYRGFAEVTGSGFSDLIVGTGGDDRLFGAGSGDLIEGRGGEDVIEGGVGDDVLFGEAGEDVLIGVGGADYLFGGIGADVLLGGTGNDVLVGGADADQLTGGDGFDVLVGGGDGDIFIFDDDADLGSLSQALNGQAEAMIGFDNEQDLIDLTGFELTTDGVREISTSEVQVPFGGLIRDFFGGEAVIVAENRDEPGFAVIFIDGNGDGDLTVAPAEPGGVTTDPVIVVYLEDDVRWTEDDFLL